MEDVPESAGITNLRSDYTPKPDSTLAVMTRKLEDLTAKFTQLEERTTLLYRDQMALRQKYSQQCEEVGNLRAGFTSLQKDYTKLDEAHARLNENHTKLHNVYTDLRADHNSLLTKCRKWQQKVAELKVYLQAFQMDHSKLLTKQDSLQAEISNIRAEQQAEIDIIRAEQQAEIDIIRVEQQAKINNIRSEQQAEINNIRTEQQAEIDIIRTEHQAEINIIRAEQQASVSALKEVFVQKSNIVEEMMSLREEMTSQSRDVVIVKDTSSAQQGNTELHALQSDLSQHKEDNNKLQTEVTKIHAHYSKLETDQDNMKTEMDNLQVAQAKLTTDMDRISTDQETVQTDMAKLQKDHVDTVLAEQRQLQQKQDTLTADVDTVKTDVEQMRTSLEEALRKASSDITALETRLGKARQLFYVGGLNKDRTQKGQAMMFEVGMINEGGHYIEDTGVFRAPHAGLYFFTAFVASHTKDTSVYCHIMVDNACHCTVPGGYGGGSGCVMVSLTTGQRVWVKATRPAEKYMYCWFSGTSVLGCP